ncbi:MAG: hypothetical protein FD123_3357 [Bacteroidetes bacterium]|nr:MAG: hypothetical protein FD123_3357 [Bacteroidota bacterium]
MKTVILWTGGKDSCIAFHEAVKAGHEVQCLATFAPEQPDFLAHPLDAVKLQAAVTGIPHRQMTVTAPYKTSYVEQLRLLKTELGTEQVVTGDIDEVDGCANWMETCCAEAGITLWRPLWKMNRREAMQKLDEHKIRFLISCVMPDRLGPEWVGREFGAGNYEALLNESVQKNFDLCGENGEYHSLVIDAALYRKKILPKEMTTGNRNGFSHLLVSRWETVVK